MGKAQTSPAETTQRNALDRQQELSLGKFTTDQSAPELFPGESVDVGPQSILRLKPQKRWLEAQGDFQYGYLSNVYLQESRPGQRPVDTGLMIATLQAAFAPDFLQVAERNIHPRFGYRHQRYMYGLEDRNPTHNLNLAYLNFEASQVFADVRYDLSDTWRAEAGLSGQWLTGHRLDGTSGTIYQEWLPQWGVTKAVPLNDHSMFMAGYYGIYHATRVPPPQKSNLNDRLDNLLTVSYTHGFGSHLVVQPYYRFMAISYTQWLAPRTDLLHTAGGIVGWFFTPNISARLNLSYDVKESDNPVIADYRNFNGGMGLSLNYRF